MSNDWAKLQDIIPTYVEKVRAELSDRWRVWSVNLAQAELHEVIGSLLARQVTLATQLASAPSIWNAHMAPIVLRSMTDVHITLAWILGDPWDRAKKFILYGLGQEKLVLEHRKAQAKEDGRDPGQDPIVTAGEVWLSSQRFAFLTGVNVGSWSGLQVRDMAQEAGCLDLYRSAYLPFSAATHSMWHHTSRLNLEYCENPLHRYHRVPIDPDLDVDPDYLYRAARYVEKAFRLFDATFALQPEAPSALGWLANSLDRLRSTDQEADDELAPE